MQGLKVVADVETTPLSVVLARVGAELDVLASQVDRLQDGLGPTLLEAATGNPHVMAEIQGLDAIAQTLASLAGFVAGLAQRDLVTSVPIDDFTDRLPLADLADRLRGRAGPSSDCDFELF